MVIRISQPPYDLKRHLKFQPKIQRRISEHILIFFLVRL
ncbi:unnamed protein product [Paramecium octaurelia]|uniref:Uncharacterized protein n=1 Tax=Paramecium octaurelia TaxID=43137 RepID=A0A8S1T6U9_PAROT|nr:unnamed protein product [Paramecium octaurelia]